MTAVTLPDRAMRELIALASVALEQSDIGSALDEITRIAVRAVPNAVGASMTTFDDGRPSAAAASDSWSRELDELQYAEHEGPCLDCYRTGNLFRVRDLADEPRWPFYTPRAAEKGARSMVSLPMTSEGKVIGALNIYGREPDAFDSEAVSIAEIIAAHSGLATQVAASYFQHRDLAAQLREAMQSRAVIEQAKGVLMAARTCGADEAFEVLVDLSQKSNRKLRDVALALVQEASGSVAEG